MSDTKMSIETTEQRLTGQKRSLDIADESKKRRKISHATTHPLTEEQMLGPVLTTDNNLTELKSLMRNMLPSSHLYDEYMSGLVRSFVADPQDSKGCDKDLLEWADDVYHFRNLEDNNPASKLQELQHKFQSLLYYLRIPRAPEKSEKNFADAIEYYKDKMAELQDENWEKNIYRRKNVVAITICFLLTRFIYFSN